MMNYKTNNAFTIPTAIFQLLKKCIKKKLPLENGSCTQYEYKQKRLFNQASYRQGKY